MSGQDMTKPKMRLLSADGASFAVAPGGCVGHPELQEKTTCTLEVIVDDNVKIRRFTFHVESNSASPAGQAQTATQNALALKAKLLQRGIDEVVEEDVNGEIVRVLNSYLPHTFTSIRIIDVDDSVESTKGAVREDLRTSY